ncbi:MAG TPA: hypothetical protein VLQ91_19310 [Draconibacterium sp.]|nr:hypothetical protein [Draconibacterium sp.]
MGMPMELILEIIPQAMEEVRIPDQISISNQKSRNWIEPWTILMLVFNLYGLWEKWPKRMTW